MPRLPSEGPQALLDRVCEAVLPLCVLRLQVFEATNMNDQSESQTHYLPWVCRIFGHRWWTTDFVEKMEGIYKVRHSQHKQMTHCDRCGQPNPACK